MMVMSEQDEPRASRLDFVAQAAMVFAGTGSALAMWPLLAQMRPNRATPPPETVNVDLRGIPPGSMKVVRWRGIPVFVRHRTPEEVQEARATALAHLTDRLARNAMLPETAPAIDGNRTKEGHEEWLVVTGLCTHLGCVLSRRPTDTPDEAWFCPCHAARFDVSGRVRAGPARSNLPVPRYEFLRWDKLEIG
jgi:ubiquinol-cytochrome c reductase iron-sulfur subunit